MHVDPLDPPTRAAATVVILRDNPQLEVFLLKRHGLSDVLGGAYVFPGGKVDQADYGIDFAAHLDREPATLHALLDEKGLSQTDAAALYVAAFRELFEETGVLHAMGIDAAGAQRAGALMREGRQFGELLSELGLRLQASRIVPWSRWITPLVGGVVRKRFDTRFFVGALPPGQVAAHDNHEATESRWLAPREALRQYWDGQIELAPPQIMSLAHLARHRDTASVLREAAGRPPPVICPEAFEHEGERILCYPGDARHSVAVRALPGPTRLHHRNQRFEPQEGFEALWL